MGSNREKCGRCEIFFVGVRSAIINRKYMYSLNSILTKDINTVQGTK